jgi:hypothetical protein
MQSLHDTERLAKLSRALGVLSISIPLLSLLLPFFLQGIAINDPGPIATAFNLISTGGGLLGVPGYAMAALAGRNFEAVREAKISAIISAGRTTSIIGMVIFLLFFCTRLNSGFAF